MQQQQINETIATVLDERGLTHTVRPYQSAVDQIAERVAADVTEKAEAAVAKAEDLGYEEQARAILIEVGLLSEPEPEPEPEVEQDEVSTLRKTVESLSAFARRHGWVG